HGELGRFHEIDRKTDQTLREALRERPDNSFASFGLARYLIDCYEDSGRECEPSGRARLLAETVELLQVEPEANFQDEWDELYVRAIGLLQDAAAEELINSLIAQRDELGHALKALRCLGGYIPTLPTEDPHELDEIRKAAEVLRSAELSTPHKPSP